MAEDEGTGAGLAAGTIHRRDVPKHHEEHLEIKVNNHPVRFDEREVSGQQIVDAAIAQGLDIKRDFVLSREISPGKYEIIGADQRIKIHTGERFRANVPDDNS